MSNGQIIYARYDFFSFVILYHIMVTNFFYHINTYLFNIQTDNKSHGPETHEMASLWHSKKTQPSHL